MSEDLIKRSDAIEAYSDIYWIDDRLNLAFREELDKIDEKIRNIPIVEVVDRPQGEWIDNGDRYFRCSLCGTKDTDNWHWCHGCGAQMKGADDETAT